MGAKGALVKSFLLRYRNQIVIFLTPLLILPLPLVLKDSESLCAYILILMAVYWCTEVLPLAVTGILPLFLVPMFNIMKTSDVCDNYLKDTTVMFVGGLMVAAAIENSNLHRRIAIRVLLTAGTKPQWLMFGFMLPTWFLSMWISNTATCAMMIPIMEAVLDQLQLGAVNSSEDTDLSVIATPDGGVQQPNGDIKESNGKIPHSNGKVSAGEEHEHSNGEATVITEIQNIEVPHLRYENNTLLRVNSYINTADIMQTLEPKSSIIYNMPETSDGQQVGDDNHSDEQKNFKELCKGMTLAVAYAANCGGIATLTGTGPNTIMKGHVDDIWMSKDLGESPVTYASWLVFGAPISLLCFLIVWVWLMLFYLGPKGMFNCGGSSEDGLDTEARAMEVIRKEHKALGPIRFEEVASGLVFFTLVMLWFFRSPGFMDGWASSYPSGFIGDAVPAMFLATLCFAIPKNIPKCGVHLGSKKVETLLNWRVVHEKFPWSVIFLMGGGFALAEACEKSGLSQWIGAQLSVFGSLPGWLMVFIIGILVAALTEVTSNSATCTILMPIMAAMAENLGMNPLYLMFPVTISTSFAFMLPVATPPNAIAFSYGRLKIIDMVKAGAILNVLCVAVVTLATFTWGMAFFDFTTLPWASNSTETTQATSEW